MNEKIKGLYVDENVVRFVAAQVIFITIVALVEQWAWLSAALAVDFGIRAFTVFPSPLAAFSKKAVETAGLKPRPIFAPPKRFAAGLGFAFSIAITFLLYLDLVYSAYAVGAILIFCAVLESAFKICLGCHVYNWIVLPIQNRIRKTN